MNIYIANLSYDVNDADLKELFEEYGSVSSAKVIMDKMSGKSEVSVLWKWMTKPRPKML
jgi:RNA recognition motif-containing protein